MCNGRTTHLEPKMMEVLVYLAEHQGGVVPKEELMRTVWADTFVTDDVLTRCIHELRRALEDDAKEPHVIQTVPKRGYRLMLAVEPVVPVPGPPVLPRAISRGLFAFIQVSYAAFYILALARLEFIHGLMGRVAGSFEWPVVNAVLITGIMGLAARLYSLAAASLDFPGFGKQFHRIFPALLVLDCIWGLAPFLLAEKMGIGLAFAAAVGLLFLPFAQRTLVCMAYDR
ncbi:MAG: winged helix-turn-helix domain-containing protein [Terriglobales bacterium]